MFGPKVIDAFMKPKYHKNQINQPNTFNDVLRAWDIQVTLICNKWTTIILKNKFKTIGTDSQMTLSRKKIN